MARFILGTMLAAFIAATAIAVLAVSVARSEWRPEYAQAAPETRAWYREAELTEAAKQRFPFKKCCDHADVFHTQFRTNKDNGGDEWWYLTPDAAWKLIPADIIHIDRHAPDNQPTLFIYSGQETCFFPGSAGG